ncbi:MAG TPA: glycosyltransferase [Acidimicrobiales bacterium]|jgi:GT2 family glycosyltransferase|nr:glycosyltransferase [Acidimicrobiales bacterium]
MTAPTASVAVITYERPDFVARCLDHLLVQTRAPLEIIVIDSSAGDETSKLVGERYPMVRYQVCTAGSGAMATARNISYRMASGDVLAFIDDDAFAEPEWLENLLPHFDDPTVGAVGGRQIRRQPGELTEGVDAIGQLQHDGNLTGNFAADPGRTVAVDHLLGANMSFRRSVLDQIGGIHDGYGGTCVREETDLCLRVAHAGYRLVYTPEAVVEHVAAPYAKGQRFDLRYEYWAQKNHLIVLIRNFGASDPIILRYVWASIRRAVGDIATRTSKAGSRARAHDLGGAVRSTGGAVLRASVVVAATGTGAGAGLQLAAADRRG